MRKECQHQRQKPQTEENARIFEPSGNDLGGLCFRRVGRDRAEDCAAQVAFHHCPKEEHSKIRADNASNGQCKFVVCPQLGHRHAWHVRVFNALRHVVKVQCQKIQRAQHDRRCDSPVDVAIDDLDLLLKQEPAHAERHIPNKLHQLDHGLEVENELQERGRISCKERRHAEDQHAQLDDK